MQPPALRPAQRRLAPPRLAVPRGLSADGGLFELVYTNSNLDYYVRSAGRDVRIADTAAGFPIFTRYTPTYRPQWDDFGLTAGGETATCALWTGTLDCLTWTRDTWVAEYDNFKDAPSATAQPWMIGLKTRDLRCSSLPGDSVIADYDHCKDGTVPRRETTFVHDGETGAINSMDVEPNGPADQHLEVAYSREGNPHGLITKVTRSALGDSTLLPRVDKVGYDSQFVYPTSFTNALDQTTASAVDPALGVPLSATDPNNVNVSYDYDTFGRVRRVNAPGGGGASITYARDATDPTLVVTKTIVDGGGESRQFINRLGQQVRQETKNFDGSFSYVLNGYDAMGLLQTVTRPRKVGTSASSMINWFHDELGRTISTFRDEEAVDGSGAPVTSALTKTLIADRVSTFTDESLRQTRYTTDELGRLIRSEMQNEHSQWVPTQFAYGHFGLLDSVGRYDGTGAPAGGRVTQTHYDVLGRRTELIDPDAGTRKTTYNAFGDVRTETDANQSTMTYTTDVLGRVTKKVDKDGSTTFTWDTADNGIGKLAESASPSGVKRKFLYDSAGRTYRETWTIDNKSYQVDYAFDPSGRLSKVTYPDAPGFGRLAVKNVYDPNTGRLSKVQKDGATSSYWTLSATDVDGSIKTEVFGNSLTSSYTTSQVTGRLMGVTTKKSSTPVRSWGYAYLPDGNLQRRSDLLASQHERFEYDPMDRIKRWVNADAAGKEKSGGWSVKYTIDDFGSMTDRDFLAGSSTGGTSQLAHFTIDPTTHRVTASSLWTGTYTYDANGNQTGRPDGEAVTYTAFDLPKKITGPRPAEFDYDASGTRARKVKTGTSTQTVYVAGLYEKRVSGSTKEHVYYVMGPRGVVAQVTRPEGGTEDTKYLHSDNLGSVDGVSTSSGTLTQSKRDPYGNAVTNFNQPKLPTTITASTNPVRLGFTGHEQDDELGMINMRGRMFDPRLGRFLTPDPVASSPANGLSYNRYAYVLNNPIRLWDPSGLEPCLTDPSRDCWTQNTTVPGTVAGGGVGAVIERLYPANIGYFCAESNTNGWNCTVWLPTGPPPTPMVDPAYGSDNTGSQGGSDSGAGGTTGSGGSGGSTSPPPPGRKVAQDCTQPCHDAQGGNAVGNNIYFDDQGNGFDPVSGVALSGQAFGTGAMALGGSAAALTLGWGGLAIATRLGSALVPVATAGGGVVLTQTERLKIFYDRLGAAPAARTAQEAVGLLSRTLDAVEDAYSGVAKVAEPGLVLLCHKRPQQGQHGSSLARARAINQRMVAMDAGLWRSGRIGTSPRAETVG